MFIAKENPSHMEASFHQIISSEKPVLVDFYLPASPPCRRMKPVLDAVQKSLGNRITVVQLDLNKCRDLAFDYNIQYVPTMMLFQKGKKLWQQSGQSSVPELLGTIIERST